MSGFWTGIFFGMIGFVIGWIYGFFRGESVGERNGRDFESYRRALDAAERFHKQRRAELAAARAGTKPT